MAVIWNANNVAAARYLAESRSAARSLGLQIQSVEVREPSDLDAAFGAIVAARRSALMTILDQEKGLGHAYGPSLAANFHQAATFW